MSVQATMIRKDGTIEKREFMNWSSLGAYADQEHDQFKGIDAHWVADIRGEWTTKRTKDHDGEWYCSVCGYEPMVFENTPYCPECGSKMRGNEQ